MGIGNQLEQNKEKQNEWDRIIQPASSYVILGDVDTGKSGLAYWLLERFSKRYNLLPAVVGFPREKLHLLPDDFATPSEPSECVGLEDAIVLIDEADIQLPIEDTKARKYVVNFLSLPQHRNQIFLLAFHFPRLALGRYLPFFSAFLLKRPPYLIEFAGKRQADELTRMMRRAEDRFSELTSAEEVVKHTYVVAPRIRWQGMVENPLPSFWSIELRKAWAGVGLGEIIPQQQARLPFRAELSELLAKERLNIEIGHLFPDGITDDILDTLIAYDGNYSLEELKAMCREAGVSVHGHKKLLAAKLIAQNKITGKLFHPEGSNMTEDISEGLSVSEEEIELYKYALQLFTSEITDKMLADMAQYNTTYSLKKLQQMCVEKNLSIVGRRAILCARLIVAKAREG